MATPNLPGNVRPAKIIPVYSNLHALALVRNEASERQHAIDLASGDVADDIRTTYASAHWSRQIDDLNATILRELPASIADALTLACAAWEQQGTFFPAEVKGLDEANSAAEQVECGLQHLVAFLAGLTPPTTESEVRSVAICQRAVRDRDPHRGAEAATWRDARRAYDAAKAAEVDAGTGLDADRLGEARYAAEDVLMAIPSPDAAAFALKYCVAHGDGRETNCWNAMLDAEAKRFAEVEG